MNGTRYNVLIYFGFYVRYFAWKPSNVFRRNAMIGIKLQIRTPWRLGWTILWRRNPSGCSSVLETGYIRCCQFCVVCVVLDCLIPSVTIPNVPHVECALLLLTVCVCSSTGILHGVSKVRAEGLRKKWAEARPG